MVTVRFTQTQKDLLNTDFVDARGTFIVGTRTPERDITEILRPTRSAGQTANNCEPEAGVPEVVAGIVWHRWSETMFCVGEHEFELEEFLPKEGGETGRCARPQLHRLNVAPPHSFVFFVQTAHFAGRVLMNVLSWVRKRRFVAETGRVYVWNTIGSMCLVSNYWNTTHTTIVWNIDGRGQLTQDDRQVGRYRERSSSFFGLGRTRPASLDLASDLLTDLTGIFLTFVYMRRKQEHRLLAIEQEAGV